MKKICFVVSSFYTVNGFLLNHIASLSESNEVTVIANTGDRQFAKDPRVNYELLSVPIERKIAPFQDFRALVSLAHAFRKRRFDIVHSVTPKAGLLAMSAARFARVPIRIHTFTGQVWVTRTGVIRRILKRADTSLASMATHVLVDSPSQLEFLVDEKVVPHDKAEVLAEGSINGVDMNRFKASAEQRAMIRSRHGIQADSFVFLFLGRLNRDKGLLVLAQAFRDLCLKHDDVHLLIIGRDEENIRKQILEKADPYSNRIHFVEHTLDPEQYLASADILCLPSYREGFGNVILEAAAVGITSIGSSIYGIVDAIIDGETGLLHEAGNPIELEDCMNRLYDDPGFRHDLSNNAQKRVRDRFQQDRVTSALIDFYETITD